MARRIITTESPPMPKWSEPLAIEFCRRITLGRSVQAVCKDEDMPGHETVYMWRRTKPDFAEMLAQAREDRFEGDAHQIRELARMVISNPADNPELAHLTHERINAAVNAIDKAARLTIGALNRQAQRIELTGANGGPIKTEVSSDAAFAAFTETLGSVAARAAGGGAGPSGVAEESPPVADSAV